MPIAAHLANRHIPPPLDSSYAAVGVRYSRTEGREVGGGRPTVGHRRPWVAVKVGGDLWLGLGFLGSGVWVSGLPCLADLEREEVGWRRTGGGCGLVGGGGQAAW
jgi:hypothetical protein